MIRILQWNLKVIINFSRSLFLEHTSLFISALFQIYLLLLCYVYLLNLMNKHTVKLGGRRKYGKKSKKDKDKEKEEAEEAESK